MKLKLKMMAIAAALVAVGSANAALVGQNTGNGSLMVYAFNTDTNAYYARDLGYNLNTFLSNSTTTGAGDGGVTGDKTPEAGLTLDKNTNANFADQTAFQTWLSQQADASKVRWSLYAGDNTTTGANGVSRVLVASTTNIGPTNGLLRNGVGNATGTNGLLTLGFTGLSSTGTTLPSLLRSNTFGPGYESSLGTLDNSSNLFYFAATTQSGSSGVLPTPVKYGNSQFFAFAKLESDGDFSYTLAGVPAGVVPVPAAVWLMGSGLLGLGGMIRRRKAAAAAQG